MCYLVDTENVSVTNWLSRADGFSSNDTIILFVNSTLGGSIPITELAKVTSGRAKTRILIEKCSPGKNSMDLSIAAKSGELFSKEKPQVAEVLAVGPGGMVDGKERRKARSYTIVSNDCGYDGFIDTCRKAGHDIVRTPVVTAGSPAQSKLNVSDTGKEKAKGKIVLKELTKEQKKEINAFCSQYGLDATKVRELSKQALNFDTPSAFVGTLSNFCAGKYKKKKKLNAVMEHVPELVGIVFRAA